MGSFTPIKFTINKKIKSLGLASFMQEVQIKESIETFLNNYISRGDVCFVSFKHKNIYLQCSNNIIANELRYTIEPLKDYISQNCKSITVNNIYIQTKNILK
mgnify:CR=1 FL=1